MPSKVVLLCGLLLVAFAHTCAVALPSPGCFQSSRLTSGVHDVTVNGTERQFILRVPDGYEPTHAYRLVIALPWYGATMHDVLKNSTKYGNGSYFGLLGPANESAIFVAPQGIDNMWMNTNGDDVLFMDALVELIGDGLCVETTQRFAVGFSFGGSMTYAIANTRGMTFRGAAILSGTDFTPWAGETVPVAVLVVHGVSDPGNLITKGRLMRDRFVDVNGCAAQVAPEPAAGSRSHIVTMYTNCTSGRPVAFAPFDGVHEYSPLDADAETSWVPSAIWTFFTERC